jgi:hypothetical protein
MNCDDEMLTGGENLAVLGNEVIQFGNAVSLGGGRFRLSRLLRGRAGSEWACGGHSAGEAFCLLKPSTLQPVAMPNWSVGATLSATSRNGPSVSVTLQVESVRPPSPVNLVAIQPPGGGLLLTWTRRSRLGFAWVDGIDAPLGEANEQYRVNLVGPSGSTELLATSPFVTIAAADVAALGLGETAIEVRQIGDVAVSRPAELTLTIS